MILKQSIWTFSKFASQELSKSVFEASDNVYEIKLILFVINYYFKIKQVLFNCKKKRVVLLMKNLKLRH